MMMMMKWVVIRKLSEIRARRPLYHILGLRRLCTVRGCRVQTPQSMCIDLWCVWCDVVCGLVGRCAAGGSWPRRSTAFDGLVSSWFADRSHSPAARRLPSPATGRRLHRRRRARSGSAAMASTAHASNIRRRRFRRRRRRPPSQQPMTSPTASATTTKLPRHRFLPTASPNRALSRRL